MSRLTTPQRLGILLLGILLMLAVIAIALMPAPKADIPVYERTAAPADSAITIEKPKKVKKQKPKTPRPAPKPRNPLDETI